MRCPTTGPDPTGSPTVFPKSRQRPAEMSILPIYLGASDSVLGHTVAALHQKSRCKCPATFDLESMHPWCGTALILYDRSDYSNACGGTKTLCTSFGISMQDKCAYCFSTSTPLKCHANTQYPANYMPQIGSHDRADSCVEGCRRLNQARALRIPSPDQQHCGNFVGTRGIEETVDHRYAIVRILRSLLLPRPYRPIIFEINVMGFVSCNAEDCINT